MEFWLCPGRSGAFVRRKRSRSIAQHRTRDAGSDEEIGVAHRTENGNFGRDAVSTRQGSGGTEGRLVIVQIGSAAEGGQQEDSGLGRFELRGIGRVFQAVEMGFGVGVEAEQERHLRDIGEAGDVAVVSAGSGARRHGVAIAAGGTGGISSAGVRGCHGHQIRGRIPSVAWRFAARTSGGRIGGRTQNVKILAGSYQHAASRFHQHALAGIGQAGHLHGAFINRYRGLAARPDLDAELGAAHGNRGRRAVHAIWIGSPAEVVDFDTHIS